MRNDTFNARNRMPDSLDLTVRDALRWGTANGAHAMGLEHRIGSLTPGKQADVIVIGGRRLNMVADGRSRRLHGRAGEPVQRPRTCSSRGASSSATASSSASISTAPSSSPQAASERVLGASRPAVSRCWRPRPDGFADLINTLAAQNLARAWTIAVAA